MHTFHCTPQFESFAYQNPSLDKPLPRYNLSAFDLTTQIATEPVIARYIKFADFSHDTWPPRARPLKILPDINLGDPVVSLFANSTYFKEAGLGWKSYYHRIQTDLEDRDRYRYSQHAATLLLKLLPDIQTLKIPVLYKAPEASEGPLSEELLCAIVPKAKRQGNGEWNKASLADLSSLEPRSKNGFGLGQAIALLALPNMRAFECTSCEATDGSSSNIASQDPYLDYGAALETAHLHASRFDVAAINTFLRQTRQLRCLEYSQDPQDNCQDCNYLPPYHGD